MEAVAKRRGPSIATDRLKHGEHVNLLQEGETVRDTYQVERLLGEGAFAQVYRVKHKYLGRQAMKVFKTPGVDAKEIEDWLGEAVLLSRIGHPNIIRVFDANVHHNRNGDLGFFTMEYVAGGSLERFWQSHGQSFVPVEVGIDIIRQACRGLTVAHSESPPIIHRDLKPQNILVGYDPQGLRVRLSDFGLAKRVNPLTLLASAKGTLVFKAPEALADPGNDSAAADVWALGATLYLLLTDRLPYAPDRLDQMTATVRNLPSIACPSQFNYNVDQVLDRLVARVLDPDPSKRHRDAMELLADLENLGGGTFHAGPGKKPPIGSDRSKSALGEHTPADEASARDKVARAREMAKQASRLIEAADLLEEAITEWPQLKEEHAYLLSLWRRGVLM